MAKGDVTNHKPFPDVFLKAAEKLGMETHKCVVFEDAPAGIEAARRAGMKCVGVLTKYLEKEDIRDVDIMINNFTEIDYPAIADLLKNN